METAYRYQECGITQPRNNPTSRTVVNDECPPKVDDDDECPPHDNACEVQPISTKTVEELRLELLDANNQINILKEENKALRKKLHYLESSKKVLVKNNFHQDKQLMKLRCAKFSHGNIKNNPSTFKYLCGLTAEKFSVLFNIILPYLNCIVYPSCKGSIYRSVDKPTELFSFLTMCRHSLHLGIMGHMMNVSQATVHRIFVGWVLFLETLFNDLNLKPEEGFLLKKMPDIFIKTGHGLTDIVIDCTEFKFQHATNFDLNTLMFSNYKNTQTGKALIGISPHGSGLLFSDIYPGSINDSTITEKLAV